MTPTIVALRRAFRSVLDAELERSQRGKLRHLTAEDREALHMLFDAALNKLLHPPTQRLRQMASDAPPPPELESYVDALSELFALEEPSGVVTRASVPPEPAVESPQPVQGIRPSEAPADTASTEAFPEAARRQGAQ